MTPKISLIAVITEDRALGKDNQLLFKIPEDLKRFREITTGHPIIMGRKTFESIGRVLPNRQNIIVSRHPFNFQSEKSDISNSTEMVMSTSIEQAIDCAKEFAKKNNLDEIFIIGGGQIFEQAIKFADKLYLTIIEGKLEADTYFPDFSDFKKIIKEENFTSGNYKGKFLELEK